MTRDIEMTLLVAALIIALEITLLELAGFDEITVNPVFAMLQGYGWVQLGHCSKWGAVLEGERQK